MFKNRLIFLFVLVCLLAALTPTSDIDHDGFLDSLVTEGFLLAPALCSVTGLTSILFAESVKLKAIQSAIYRDGE